MPNQSVGVKKMIYRFCGSIGVLSFLQSLDRHQRESGLPKGYIVGSRVFPLTGAAFSRAMESALNRAQAKAMREQTLFDKTAAVDQLGQASR